MERDEWNKFTKRYPNQRARKAADEAVDQLPNETSLINACEVWNDIYLSVAGSIRLTPRR